MDCVVNKHYNNNNLFDSLMYYMIGLGFGPVIISVISTQYAKKKICEQTKSDDDDECITDLKFGGFLTFGIFFTGILMLFILQVFKEIRNVKSDNNNIITSGACGHVLIEALKQNENASEMFKMMLMFILLFTPGTALFGYSSGLNTMISKCKENNGYNEEKDKEKCNKEYNKYKITKKISYGLLYLGLVLIMLIRYTTNRNKRNILKMNKKGRIQDVVSAKHLGRKWKNTAYQKKTDRDQLMSYLHP